MSMIASFFASAQCRVTSAEPELRSLAAPTPVVTIHDNVVQICYGCHQCEKNSTASNNVYYFQIITFMDTY